MQNIKHRNQYGRYDFDVSQTIAKQRLMDFGTIKSGYYTYGVGQKPVAINSLNEYCRRPAHLFGATIRSCINEILATASRIKPCHIKLKKNKFDAKTLVINIKDKGIEVRYRPSTKGHKALRKAFADQFCEALSCMENVSGYTTTESESHGLPASAVHIDIRLTDKYLLSYAPYTKPQEEVMEKEFMQNPFKPDNLDNWKVKGNSYFKLAPPASVPIEKHYANQLSNSISQLDTLIESEKNSIADVLKRIKNMEKQRAKLQAAFDVLN